MILLSPSYLRDKNEIYVYVEKFNKDGKYVLIDFLDSIEFIFFNTITGLSYDWERRPTMIEILNYTQKKLQEGVTYRISSSTISSLIPIIEIVEDSLIIGFRIELTKDDPDIFGFSKSFNWIERFVRNMDDTDSSKLPAFYFNFKSIDQIIVRNIGQGSWNELVSKDRFQLVFDFGTIYTTKRADVLRLIGNRNAEYQISKPLFILSHWDVDHYHFLLGFDDKTIKSIPHFIYRASIPNLTARKALGRFRILNNKALIPLASVSPHPRRSSKRLVPIYLTASRDHILFNGSKNRSRNKSGIGLSLRKKKISVVFSTDFDYLQVSDSILPELNYPCDHYLVAPHHGGNAGKFIYKSFKKNKLKEAVISVGLNPYNPPHPFPINISNLVSKGFKVVRTDSLGSDYSINI